MKTLILVRHAKSSWKHPDLEDFDRPLNKRGSKDAPKMGRRLAKAGILPDLIISSPARRAYNTAMIIAVEIGYDKEIQKDKTIYEAATSDLLEVIRAIDDKYKVVMMIGHNPAFTSLSYYLTRHSVTNIPTAGVFTIDFSKDSWADVSQGSGKFISFDYPKR